jgi:hypothetical protein
LTKKNSRDSESFFFLYPYNCSYIYASLTMTLPLDLI